jgi:hypothetical protein
MTRHTCFLDDGGTPGRKCLACEQEAVQEKTCANCGKSRKNHVFIPEGEMRLGGGPQRGTLVCPSAVWKEKT